MPERDLPSLSLSTPSPIVSNRISRWRQAGAQLTAKFAVQGAGRLAAPGDRIQLRLDRPVIAYQRLDPAAAATAGYVAALAGV